MKTIFKITIGLLILANGYSRAEASGGWTGNAPLASYTPPIAFQYYPGEETPEEEWNSILLPKGQARLGFRYTYCDSCVSSPKSEPGIDFSYGFTSNLSMLSLLTFGYSLQGNKGAGSEWAFLFGITRGINSGGSSGTIFGPGVGIAYAYTESNWRLDVSSTLSGYYRVNNNSWSEPGLSTTVSLTYWFNEKLAVGASISHNYQKKYSFTASCNQNCDWSEREVVVNELIDRKVYALLRLNKDQEMQMTYQDSNRYEPSKMTLGYSVRW